MFAINGNLKEFTQWQQGYSLTNPNMKKGDKIHFVSSSGESSVMRAKEVNGTVLVEVPNILLKHVSNITAQFMGGGDLTLFAVKSATKPDAWELVDNEPKSVSLFVQSE
jgi:hypothetical protein